MERAVSRIWGKGFGKSDLYSFKNYRNVMMNTFQMLAKYDLTCKRRGLNYKDLCYNFCLTDI